MKSHYCSRELYTKFLEVTSARYSAFSLAEVSPINLSHDAVSRWLSASTCQSSDIWNAAKSDVIGTNGMLIGDDSVLDKSRSQKMELVHYQYSGNVHDVITGIGMVNLLWRRDDGEVMPADVRIYNPPEDGKTKNDQFQEMLKIAKHRGITPEAVVADSWYASLNNLKCIRDLGWVFVVGLRKNRIINRGEHVGDIKIPEEGVRVHLRGYGFVQLFRFDAKNGRTDYIATNMSNPTREKVEQIVKARWSIEVYHRELKQTCGLACCQSRNGRAQRNHIGLSVLSWIRKSKSRHISSLYQQKWHVVKQAVALSLKRALVL